MRITLNIDDVLLAARAIARRDKKTVGQVISELGQITMDRQFSGLVSKALPNRVEALEEKGIPDAETQQKRLFQMAILDDKPINTGVSSY